MSDPAAYAIVEGGQTTFYYYRSGALSIVPVLFFGPELAIRYIQSQNKEVCFQSGIAEGDSFLDINAGKLAFFGNDYAFHAELLATLLPLMQINWPGWDIRYALDELFEIAELLKLDFPSRRECSSFRAHEYPFNPPRMSNPPEYYTCLLTIRDVYGVRDLDFEDGGTNLLALGPKLINQIKN